MSGPGATVPGVGGSIGWRGLLSTKDEEEIGLHELASVRCAQSGYTNEGGSERELEEENLYFHAFSFGDSS